MYGRTPGASQGPPVVLKKSVYVALGGICWLGGKCKRHADFFHQDIYHFCSSIIAFGQPLWLKFKGPIGSLLSTCRILWLLCYWFIHFEIPSHWFISLYIFWWPAPVYKRGPEEPFTLVYFIAHWHSWTDFPIYPMLVLILMGVTCLALVFVHVLTLFAIKDHKLGSSNSH